MKLDESQRQKVAEWIGAGLKLSEIQNRLASELGVAMTYMDVRFLVDDLKLTPKDPEPVKAPESVLTAPGAIPTAAGQPPAGQPGRSSPQPAGPSGTGGGISLSVDQVTRPGAVVSGKVTFSDGKGAAWHIDQTGRLGLAPEQAGYRPPNADLQQFQATLETELSRLGF
jgi:hypothetical protein